MTEEKRVKYETLYKKCWIAQNIKDKEDNPRFNGGKDPSRPNVNNQQNGRLGGRPLKLSKEATMLNKLLLKGLSLEEAIDILDMSMQSASQIKAKYKLPRKETCPK